MMLDIILIMPNFNWRITSDFVLDPPMGILYIAAVLEKHNYKVMVVDANAASYTEERVIEIIRDESPKCVGISCNYSPLHNITIDLCLKIKSISKNIITFVGGNHATASGKYLLEQGNGALDFVVNGHGENVVLNALKCITKNEKWRHINGISYVEGDQVITNEEERLMENINNIPMPAYHLVNMNKYDRYNIITARGCPYHCRYCASNVIGRGAVLYRNPNKIVDEIIFLIEAYGRKRIWFSDDTFTSKYSHTMEILDLIIERNLNIEWSCLTRVNRVHKDLLEKMKIAGCKYISYGVESGDKVMLEKMNKKITLDDIRSTLKLTKEIGIDFYLFFMIGYPGETLETVNNNYQLIKEIRPTGVSFSIVIPLPGTALWSYLEEKGIISFNSLQWDYLFAKTGKGKYENYAAEIASSWLDFSAKELLAFCEKGEKLLTNKFD